MLFCHIVGTDMSAAEAATRRHAQSAAGILVRMTLRQCLMLAQAALSRPKGQLAGLQQLLCVYMY